MLSGGFLFFSSIGQVQGRSGLLQILIGLETQKRANHANIYFHCFYANFMLIMRLFGANLPGAGALVLIFTLLACPGQPSDAARLDLDLVSKFQSLVRTFWLTGTKL